jgi:hypothetical protein
MGSIKGTIKVTGPDKESPFLAVKGCGVFDVVVADRVVAPLRPDKSSWFERAVSTLGSGSPRKYALVGELACA